MSDVLDAEMAARDCEEAVYRAMNKLVRRIRAMRGLVYQWQPDENNAKGWTWKQEAERLRKDNAVLAAEVRAYRDLGAQAEKVGGDVDGANRRLERAEKMTDASGALERAGGGA